MPAVRGGMGKHSSAVPGQGKVFQIDQPKAYRGQYGKNGKDHLECGFGIAGGRLTSHDIIYDVLSGNRAGGIRLRQFSIGANKFFWFFAVSACRKKRRSGIPSSRAHPEAVYKVVIRAEGRQAIWTGAAGKDSQGNGFGKDIPHP